MSPFTGPTTYTPYPVASTPLNSALPIPGIVSTSTVPTSVVTSPSAGSMIYTPYPVASTLLDSAVPIPGIVPASAAVVSLNAAPALPAAAVPPPPVAALTPARKSISLLKEHQILMIACMQQLLLVAPRFLLWLSLSLRLAQVSTAPYHIHVITRLSLSQCPLQSRHKICLTRCCLGPILPTLNGT